jgi:heme A synthase
MLLTGVMTGTLWWETAGRTPAPTLSRGLALSMVLLVVVAAMGAAVALGDTLFPPDRSARLSADLNPTSHFHRFGCCIRCCRCRPDPDRAGAPTDVPRTRRRVVADDVIALAVQAGVGVLNVLLLAPLWLQMTHLLESNLVCNAVVWGYLNGYRGHGGRAGGHGAEDRDWPICQWVIWPFQREMTK